MRKRRPKSQSAKPDSLKWVLQETKNLVKEIASIKTGS
jgi:hypothetical protein